ncbi:fanconi-associated nuclease 1 [Erpetoichthys calabaricus]|uniref:fanconi-associated nuclease 1 n=1 Tax=Erpetoichthys calabaricus TaxID=27687 RepID=UPI002234B0C1|nr:fanconi-associated nuclease 1 [Erpetoichthys calabaricus]
MSEKESPAKKRARKTLSLSNRKSRNQTVTGNAVKKTPTIIQFFNNVPPVKLACPICGEMVSRFWINEHIDANCQSPQKSDRKDLKGINSKSLLRDISNPETSDSCTRTPEKVKTPETSHSFTRTPVKSLKSAGCVSTPEKPRSTDGHNASSEPETERKRTSPYFEKQALQQPQPRQYSSKVVRKINLGSLASKLSKKKTKEHSDSSQVSHQETLQATDCQHPLLVGETDSLSSSQKENHCFEDCDLTNVDDTNTEMLDLCTRNSEKQESVQSKIPEPLLSGAASSSFQALVSFQLNQSNGNPNIKVNKEFTALGTHDLDISEESVNLSLLKDSMVKHSDDNNMPNLKREIDSSAENLGAQTLSVSSLFASREAAEYISNAVSQIPESKKAKDHSEELQRLPYYLRNFLIVLHTVMGNEEDRQLFNEEDLAAIDSFQKLSVAGQKLYVRLFQRKLNWLKVSKLEYSEISTDLGPVIHELVSSDFLQAESDLDNVSEVLELLSAPDLKTLAKTFHLTNPSGQKQQLVEDFLRLSKQRSLFESGNKQSRAGLAILKKAKELAGKCVRVCKGPRNVFSRVLLLFSLTDSMEDEEAASGGQGQLYTILMVNMGRMIFPSYVVQRKTKVFLTRDDVLRYEAAMHMLNNISASMLSGHWEEAHQIYLAAKASWRDLALSADLSYFENLPVYLRCFSVGWVYTRILSRGVEVLQRLRMYKEAVEELRNLLSQTTYCPDSRGRWWDRMALNLQQHLKCIDQSIHCIKEGLSDPLVRTGHRLSLLQRAARMKESPSCKKHWKLLQDVPSMDVQDVSHVTIRGKMCPQMGMGKSVFLMEDIVQSQGQNERHSTSSETVMCSVEELALAHYRQQGFDQGIHGEGSTFSTLFGLFMWDIIFMGGIEDVFRNAYQVCPLDLHTDSFYENRKTPIKERLDLLQEASVETLQMLVAETWNSQHGKINPLVNWERFVSLEQAQSLAACLGGVFLSGMVRRFCKDYRHCRGGLPDLVVWETQTLKYKLVEVKGPNDRLSHKQMIWLDELHKLGAQVEVCHVTAIGARSLRVS